MFSSPEQKADTGGVGRVTQGVGDAIHLSRSAYPYRELHYLASQCFYTGQVGAAAGKYQTGRDQLFNFGAWHLQQDEPGDYVVATGECHSVREFLDEVFAYLDMDWHEHVEIDPRYFRPSEVDVLQGDAGKARSVLQWEPRVTFRELAQMMVDADTRLAERERALNEHDARKERPT